MCANYCSVLCFILFFCWPCVAEIWLLFSLYLSHKFIHLFQGRINKFLFGGFASKGKGKISNLTKCKWKNRPTCKFLSMYPDEPSLPRGVGWTPGSPDPLLYSFIHTRRRIASLKTPDTDFGDWPWATGHATHGRAVTVSAVREHMQLRRPPPAAGRVTGVWWSGRFLPVSALSDSVTGGRACVREWLVGV